MTMIAEYLAEQKRLAEAATEGPWKLDVARYDTDFGKVTDYGVEGVASLSEFEDSSPWHMACYPLGQEDAEFIAAARESVPRMIAALEAVTYVHRRSYAVFSWASGGVRYEDPCPDCDGKAGVHPCGCWADVDTEYVCSECKVGEKGASVPWPCPTIRAVEAALGGEADG